MIDNIFIIILGFIMGSFLNLCIYRIPREQSIVYPKSHCTNCRCTIRWYDLIPIFSYMILLKGKCRYCGHKISMRYPIIEFITGIVYLIIYIKYGLTLECLKYITFMTILIVVGMIDFDTTDVYFSITLTGIIFAVLFIFANSYFYNDYKQYIFGGVFGVSIMTIIILLTNAMGWGDAEMYFFSGLFLGFKLMIVMMFFSFVFGAVISLLLVTFKKIDRKTPIPFGPFIGLATIFTIFFGSNIVLWYMT